MVISFYPNLGWGFFIKSSTEKNRSGNCQAVSNLSNFWLNRLGLRRLIHQDSLLDIFR